MIDYQGEKFKEYLVKNKISIVRAAENLGVSRQNVYQYFKTTNLERSTVNKLLDTFQATAEEMFGINEKQTNSFANKSEIELMLREIIAEKDKRIALLEEKVKGLETQLATKRKRSDQHTDPQSIQK